MVDNIEIPSRSVLFLKIQIFKNTNILHVRNTYTFAKENKKKENFHVLFSSQENVLKKSSLSDGNLPR